MPKGSEKLAADLEILEAMADKMAEYLPHEDIFWPKIDSDPIQPTVGGYLVRRHRLVGLQDSLLNSSQRERLEAALAKVERTRAECGGCFDQKAAREFQARLRQWDQALAELLADDPPSMAYYRSDVETRLMIKLLLNELPSPEADALAQLEQLDDRLQQRWQPGAFIWPQAWQPVYPKANYWWLYGQLTESSE